MTKKGYEIIAACIGAAYVHCLGDEIVSQGIDDIMYRLQLEFSLNDPRFSPIKFTSRIQYWIGQHTGN
jgi:hypothetical protein